MTTTPTEKTESSQETHLKKPDFRRETRLGLVLYGGVSLAVYMNGVCREFYNAMRGRGIYKLIKALTDSDIVVDIVSGTSAGGINGVLLSYAIANSYPDRVVDFDEFGDIWRESGDINKLMRSVKPKKEETVINSILDGKGYYQDRLFNAFKKAGNNEKPAPDGEWYSDFKELDLFMTGTDVLGRIYKTFDNTGKVIEIKDHRSVFHLKYREDQDFGDPFAIKDDITHQALAKLCRITSCFPVAFPVVSVKLDPENKVSSKDNIDKKLEEWGSLLENRLLPEKEPQEGYQLHFVDGGVLDNRPFSYTTEAIYYRTAERPVNRQLFYLDPNPDSFVESSTFEEMKQPNIWEVIQDSLISLPSYESIGKDLQEIKDRNEKICHYSYLLKSVNVDEKISRQKPEDKIKNQREEEEKHRYWRCRLVGLIDRVLPLLFDNQYWKISDTQQKQKKRELEDFATLLTEFITDIEKIEERENTLNEIAKSIENCHLDFYYAVREHDFLLQQTDLMYSSNGNYEQYKALQDLAYQISWLLELIKVIGEALKEMLKLEPVRQGFYSLIKNKQTSKEDTRRQAYNYLLGLFRFLLDVDAQFLSEIIKNSQELSKDTQDLCNFIVTKLQKTQSKEDEDKQSRIIFKEMINPILNKLIEKSKELTFENHENCEKLTIKIKDENGQLTFIKLEDYKFNKSIFEVIQQASLKLINSSQVEKKEQLSKKFSNFEQIDQVIYPYEYLSDIQGKDIIKLVRISPNDADRGFGKGKGLDEKLAGDQFFAFGGFFKKSWRSNDILWGRLDGLNRIVDGLLTPDSLKSFSDLVTRQIKLEKFEGTQEKKTQKYLAELVNESFPNATQKDKDVLINNYLMKLADGEHRKQLLEKELEDFLEQLVSLGHRAIIKEDLGNVLEDAIAEQLEWNQQQSNPPKEFKNILKNLKYEVVVPDGLESLQFNNLRNLNKLVNHLVNPELLEKVSDLIEWQMKEQGQTDNQKQNKTNEKEKKKDKDEMKEKYLLSLMQNSFSNLSESKCKRLIRYPRDFEPTSPSVEELYEFLNQLLLAVEQEIDKQKEVTTIKTALDRMKNQLEKICKDLKPTFIPKYDLITGYFDQAVTPFAAKELAKTALNDLNEFKGKEEDYFRKRYRVGSEKLTNDIPSNVLKNLGARTGIILSNILESPPTGKWLRRFQTYQIASALPKIYYWLVQQSSPKTYRTKGWPKLISVLRPLILSLIVFVVIAYLLNTLPKWALVIITTLVILGIIWWIVPRK